MNSQILKLICEAKTAQEIREAIKHFDEKNDQLPTSLSVDADT